jgi:GDP-L-fucose synthase
MAAAKVGGILANDTYPADFLYDNLVIETNIIDAAWRKRRRQAAVPRLVLHLSEVRAAADPRGRLLTGPLEPTNEWYAIAKIAGIKLAQAYRRQHGCDFISAMPTNLYGPATIST